MYTFINIINLSIQIYLYKTELDLPRIRLNSRLNSCLARLILFISVPFRPFRPFFPVFFYRLNGQPFNFRLPPKQNSLPPFTVYWPFSLGEHWRHFFSPLSYASRSLLAFSNAAAFSRSSASLLPRAHPEMVAPARRARPSHA